LITRKGTYGVAAVVDEENKNMIISSEIFRILLKRDKINSYYAAIYLNTILAKLLFDRIKTGGIMGHISQEALKMIKIPVPTLDVQDKIAEEVKRRMSEAERLKIEANKIIEEAKKKVEEMISG
ncbi:MAG TPA: restriction endonuclease subunit S, partial [Candidatus Wunengus sp. YC63]|uniref:restriction endonuclease subunit S n=1 Tax=Candidatus Wunengus sp. YC63 TaxID=3367699 RepID=UPI004029BD15